MPADRPLTADAPLVRVAGVSKRFGSFPALREVALDVARGEVVVVVGASGSGKSTLCRCINRLERVDDGSITIDGVVLPEEGRALAELRSDVGMVFQSFIALRAGTGRRWLRMSLADHAD